MLKVMYSTNTDSNTHIHTYMYLEYASTLSPVSLSQVIDNILSPGQAQMMRIIAFIEDNKS